MKIIQLTTFFYPVHGGVEQMVLQLSKRLQKAGHSIKVICSDSAKTGKSVRPFREKIEGIEVERCRTWFSLSYFHKFFPSVLWKLLKSDFDIIHVQGIKKLEGYLALSVAKLKGKKVVVSTHNPFIVDSAERPFLSNLFIKVHDLTFGKLFMRFFDKFLTLSKSEYKHLKKFGVKKEKIEVIPNAVPDILWEKANVDKVAKKYSIKKEDWDAVVLNLGRIARRKGLQNLKAAVDSLPKALFLFAGPDDGYVSNLKKLYKNNSNVKFIGPVDRAETKEVFEFADIWVMPSHYEPFGVVLIEAMAKGLPVVSTKFGGPRDIVKKEFGFLVNPKDQKMIKEKIEYLIKNPQKRREMGEKAKKVAKKYSWKRVYKMYDKIYKNLY